MGIISGCCFSSRKILETNNDRLLLNTFESGLLFKNGIPGIEEIAEIVYDLGFAYPPYFSRLLKKREYQSDRIPGEILDELD